jgi:glycine hydroxymethyltransferase
VANAQALASTLMERGLDLSTGGTDNHLILVDLTNQGLTGKEAEVLLDSVGITVNKNLVPYDKRPPLDPSGIRLGTPALTTRGFTLNDMARIGHAIADLLTQTGSESVLQQVRKTVKDLTDQYSLYPEL